MLYNRQAQTGTASLPRPGFINPEKSLCNPLNIIWINANTGIFHEHFNLAAAKINHPNFNLAALSVVLNRVFNKINEHLFDLITVCPYLNVFIKLVNNQLNILIFCLILKVLYYIEDNISQKHLLHI